MAGRSRKTRSIPISALLDPALEERPESELPLRDFGWETDPYADHRPTRETQRSRCRYPRRRLDCGRAYLRRRFDRADGGGRLCRGESRLRTRATNPFHRNHRRMRSRAWVDLVSGCRRFEVANVFLHGESAGAHLSLMSAIRCRSMSGFRFLKGLVLFSGCYDLSGTPSVRSASRDTLVLYGPSLAPFLEQITGGLGEEARRDPALSPLYADLHGLPPVLLITGAQDPLHDDSILLAEKLREQGVSVDLFEVPDAPHGFNLLPIRLADFVNGWARQWMNAKTG